MLACSKLGRETSQQHASKSVDQKQKFAVTRFFVSMYLLELKRKAKMCGNSSKFLKANEKVTNSLIYTIINANGASTKLIEIITLKKIRTKTNRSIGAVQISLSIDENRRYLKSSNGS